MVFILMKLVFNRGVIAIFVKTLPPMAIMELKEATTPPMKNPGGDH